MARKGSREPVKRVKKNEAVFYSAEAIIAENADYNIIIGERGNGKTYAVQEYLLKKWIANRSQCMILRRWMDDVKSSNAQNFWDGNLLAKFGDMTEGEFTNIILRDRRYIAVRYDDKGKPIISENNIVGYVWDVNEAERMKGQSFPHVNDIVYEEFISLSKEGYLPEEIPFFLNIISTVVRDRTNVKIWLLGNTINPYNPYFEHFGIEGMKLKQGVIVTKEDRNTGCKVAIEHCAKRRKGSLYGTSAKYFGFGNNNAATKMITTGAWQIPEYPKMKFRQSEVRNMIAVRFDNRLIFVYLMYNGNDFYVYVKRMRDKAQIPPRRYVLDMEQNTSRYYFTSMQFLPADAWVLKLKDLMRNQKVWYSDDETGNVFDNFLAQSGSIPRDIR